MLLPLVLLFIVVPIVEIYVIIQVGQAIGALWTIALLIADSILGSLLMRAQGRTAWRRFNEAIAAGRMPAREVVDGALVIFGGALLLTPGFVTDIFGAAFLLPPTRAVIRALLVRRFAGRLIVAVPGSAAPAPAAPRRAPTSTAPRPRSIPARCRDGGPEHDAPRPAHGNGFSDAVTVAFGDAAAELYGVARLGLAEGGASGLAILFRARRARGRERRGRRRASRRRRRGTRSAPPAWTRRRRAAARPGACSSPATTPPSTSSSRRPARWPSSTPATTWRGPAAWRATSSRCA